MLYSARQCPLFALGSRFAIVLQVCVVLLAGVVSGGCAQKTEQVAPPTAPASSPQLPADYVQQRKARERPMPMNTQTGH